MPDVTIQQAYALAHGIWVNPYSNSRLDNGTIFATGVPSRLINQSYSPGNIYAANLSTDGTLKKNRLSALLDGTSVTVTYFNQTTTSQTLSGVISLVNRTPVFANSAAQGFETPIFAPQEFIGTTRQNYNYETGADFSASSAINGFEQLYHLAGLAIVNKLKK